MPASIHPPVQLHIVLDEDSYQGGDSVEMARRFTAVAPTEVVRAAKGSQRANVIEFDLEGGNKAIVRPSGTEPKIKLYIFAKGADAAEADALLDAIEEDGRKLLS